MANPESATAKFNHILHVLGRAWDAFIHVSMGTTTLGFFAPVVCWFVGFLLVGFAVILFRGGKQALGTQMRKTLEWAAIVASIGDVLVYGSIYSLNVAKVVYHDHVELLSLREKVRDMNQQVESSDRVAYDAWTKLPRPSLKPEQRRLLVGALRDAGPHNVLLRSADVRFTNGMYWVRILAEVFTEAGWHVQTLPIEERRVQSDGLDILTENGRPNEFQRKILGIFKTAGILASWGTRQEAFDGIEIVVGRFTVPPAEVIIRRGEGQARKSSTEPSLSFEQSARRQDNFAVPQNGPFFLDVTIKTDISVPHPKFRVEFDESDPAVTESGNPRVDGAQVLMSEEAHFQGGKMYFAIEAPAFMPNRPIKLSLRSKKEIHVKNVQLLPQ